MTFFPTPYCLNCLTLIFLLLQQWYGRCHFGNATIPQSGRSLGTIFWNTREILVKYQHFKICQYPCFTCIAKFVLNTLMKFNVEVSWIESGASNKHIQSHLKENTRVMTEVWAFKNIKLIKKSNFRQKIYLLSNLKYSETYSEHLPIVDTYL